MDRDEVLAVFDRQLRRGATPDAPGARIEQAGGVVRQVGPEHGWNGVLWSELDPGGADAAIAEQVRYFGGLGRAFEWKLYAHDRPADLGRRLLAAGFTAEPEETVMVAEVAGLDKGAEAVPEGVRLVPVTGEAEADLLAAVHERAFATAAPAAAPELAEGTDAPGVAREQVRRRLLDQLAAGTAIAVVAMAGDVPISAARMDMHPGTRFASLWGGGTVPGWRGRGVYRALVAYRAREAAARGYDYLQVDASSQSRPILLRLGFAALTTTTPYVHP
ncbi:GNAT family N-acetyltransferase [Nonomuraea zeae]|uniref:GNAT family N-acetyltransferase n=1 Tax=Nonomuraea zeae TaxID=1642303 RepID=A0A5S4FEZ2_9ACTN|nr:GNAT family N-acetyltransferase [Nonomuraea zeae]TMR17639.1 GNAT family N-acetyltransferase [Nonomuraea zeae]